MILCNKYHEAPLSQARGGSCERGAVLGRCLLGWIASLPAALGAGAVQIRARANHHVDRRAAGATGANDPRVVVAAAPQERPAGLRGGLDRLQWGLLKFVGAALRCLEVALPVVTKFTVVPVLPGPPVTRSLIGGLIPPRF